MFKRYVSTTLLVALAAFALTACSSIGPTNLTPPAQKTFLWKVTSAHRVLYLTGNSNILSAKDYPLPAPMAEAFSKSGKLVFESSPDVNKQKAEALVSKLGPLPGGETLGQKLNTTQLKRVKNAFAKVDVPFAAMQPMRPWVAGTVLQGKATMKLWHKIGAKRSDQINLYFYKIAKAKSIPIVSLQPATDIIRMLANLPEKVQVSWLMLNAKRTTKPFNAKQYKQVIQAWRGGNTAFLAKMLAKSFGGYPKLTKAAVTNRNRKWVEALEADLDKAGKPVFVIVGSGHLVGPNNMQDMLRQDGYTVTQL